jgi:enoyl-CoA hydratase/carnithine racemase
MLSVIANCRRVQGGSGQRERHDCSSTEGAQRGRTGIRHASGRIGHKAPQLDARASLPTRCQTSAVGYKHIAVDTAGGVSVITLDRPAQRNAFTGQMGQELSHAYRGCDADDDVRAVVLTGTPPAFCAGADLSPGGDTFERPDDTEFSASPVQPGAWEIRKPVIAAVNGHAIGIGLTLALQCDIRIMAEDAKYGVVQVRRGVIPDACSHWTLPRIAGISSAAEILLTGRVFDGREAKDLGIANRCLPADDVVPAAMALAHDIAANAAPLSVALSKRLLWRAIGTGPDEVARLETEVHRHVMGRADAREGVVAFLDRRDPIWEGRVSRDWPDWLE